MPVKFAAAAAGGSWVTPYSAGGRSGIWYPPSLAYNDDGVDIFLTAADEIAVPFISHVDGTLDRIGVYIATSGASGSVIRLGIRADTGNGFPSSTVILDAGTLDGTAANSVAATISQAVTAGTLYWLTVCAQGAPATEPKIYCQKAGHNRHTIVGHSSQDAVTGPHWSNATAPKQASITGALPSSWTGTDKFSYWPLIVARYA